MTTSSEQRICRTRLELQMGADDALETPTPPASALRSEFATEVRVQDVRRLHGPPDRIYEIVTRHRRYFLDARRRCIAVEDRKTGELRRDHPTLGSTVVGGQIRSGYRTEASYPLPVPGLAAVFQRRKKGARTKVWVSSRVEHVTINVHHVKLH